MGISVADHIPQSHIQVAQNLPVSNTGNVALTFKPKVGPAIEVPVKHSALLHPGEYEVTRWALPRPILIAKIVYDPNLHRFNVEVLQNVNGAQFSVLVNLTDVAGILPA